MTEETLGKIIRPVVEGYIMDKGRDLGTDYLILGIIGAQSSGKSTLLNAVFDSTFVVMNSKEKRKQTTRGIWTHISEDKRTIILDIEGADSRERWEEKYSYERRTALFGLVISNVLLINVWLQEIGRFTAANYEILKTIFELNVQFFNKETPKKIVFVIRDFNDRENFEYIHSILHEDVLRLWKEVKKPPGLEELAFDKLFRLEVVTIRSLVFEKAGFDADIVKLSNMLTKKNNPEYIFRGFDFKNLPVDGLFLYMSQIWQAILTNKDINIPNQKIMVSSFRCNEVKNESLQLSRADFSRLRSQLSADPSLNLVDEFQNIFSKSMDFYKRNTKNYDDTIALSVEEDLKTGIKQDFEEIFKEQNETYVNGVLKELEVDLRKIYSHPNSDAASILQTIVMKKNELKLKYTTFLNKYKFEPKKYDEYMRLFNLKLSNLVTSFLSSSTNTFFKKLSRGYLTTVDTKIFETFHSLSATSWDEFNAAFINLMNNFRGEMATLKNSFEEVKGIFTDELLASFEKDLVFATKQSLNNKKVYIGEYMLEDFKKKFEVNSAGVRRNWKILDDSQIEIYFQTARKTFVPTLDRLENPLVLEYDGDTVVNRQESLKIKNKFESDVNDVLEQAYNKKYNRNSLQRVPKWLWFVLAYFMHDNILEWVKSPIFFGLLIILSVALGYLYATEKMYLITNAIWMLRTFVFAKLGFGGPSVLQRNVNANTSAEKEAAKPPTVERNENMRKEEPDYR